ncbi:MAG: uncharacterized protein JWM53_910 [bacterium]|nr:uncharacterized protein [bacterium]
MNHKSPRMLAYALTVTSALLPSCEHQQPSVMATPAATNQNAAAQGVRGRVFCSAPNPAAGALVAAIPWDTGQLDALAGMARSGSDGSFALELPPGLYAINVTAPGCEGTYHPHVRVDAARMTELDSPMKPGGVTLSGRITDFGGHDVPSAMIAFARVSNEQADIWWGAADASGKYEVTLPTASYKLTPRAPGYSPIPAEATPSSPRVDLEMEPNDASRFVSAAVVEQLRRASVALATVDPAADLGDLQPLSRAVGDARIVGLGEGTHGAHETFQLKARLFRFLVEKMGFTTLGIEASWPDTLPINEYLATGQGDPARLVSGMRFWTWDTEEVGDLVRWMRTYNADPRHVKKLQIIGFDMQYTPTAVAGVLSYLARVDKPAVDHTEAALAVLKDEFTALRFGRLTVTQQRAVAQDVAALIERLERNKATLVSRGGAAAWTMARHHAEILSQFVREEASTPSLSRDQAMVDNVRAIIDALPPDGKIALWAHNAHLANRPIEGQGPTAMGQLLKKQYGAAYVTWATCFGSGAFRAVGIRPLRQLIAFTLPTPPAGSVEGTLARLGGAPVVALDLHALPPGSDAARWAHRPLRMRLIGAAFAATMGQGFRTARPDDIADAIFYIGKTTPSKYVGDDTRPMDPLAAPSNLGFEESAGLTGWLVPRAAANAGYRGGVDTHVAASGRASARLSRPGPVRMPGYGTLEQIVLAAPYVGKRVLVRASIRLGTADEGSAARLFVDLENAANSTVAAVSYDTPARSQRWVTQEVTVDVPPTASFLRFGVAASGNTDAFIDDVSVDVVEAAASQR